MNNTNSINEIAGRLWIWKTSLSKTRHLLNLSLRANIRKQQLGQKDEIDNYLQKLDDYSRQQPNYKEGHISTTHRDAFNLQCIFPTYLECCSIDETCIELAIVYFCQIFNRGDKNANTAAANEKSFRDEHLEQIISTVFNTKDKMESFNLLKEKIFIARNEMIAHADGSSFNISHGGFMSVMKGNPPISRDIDIEFWESFLEPMKTEIVNYSNLLKIK